MLAAVGGYGRGELHPYSDVDLLVLLPTKRKRDVREPVSAFLTLLWDIGLQVGHSTRTVDECRDESRRDLTTATTLMEARWLLGPEELFQRHGGGLRPARRLAGAQLLRGQAQGAAGAARAATTTRPTTWSPTSRAAPAGCATST